MPILMTAPPAASAVVAEDEVDDDCVVLDDGEPQPEASAHVSAAAVIRASAPDENMKTSAVRSERRTRRPNESALLLPGETASPLGGRMALRLARQTWDPRR